MPQRPLLTFLAALTLGAAGCVGSPNPYRPGHQRRPAEVAEEDEVEVMRRDEVPPAIVRHDAWVESGRKEARRILSDTSVNPWDTHRDELVAALGAAHAKPYLGSASALASSSADEPEDAPAADREESDSEGDGDADGDEWGDSEEKADQWGDDW